MAKIVRVVLIRTPVFLQIHFCGFILFFEQVLQFFRCFYLRLYGMKEYQIEYVCSNNKICHILASGWSLNESYDLIDKDSSFIIGFNFSFLKCKNPDLHFIENASLMNKNFLENTIYHYYGLKSRDIFSKTKVVFKNLSEYKNSVKLIRILYSKQAMYVKDKHFRFFSKESIPGILDIILSEKKNLPQSISTVLSMVFLARLLGFKKIVIHGLDFYGNHFYGEDLKYAINNNSLSFSNSNEKILHKTALGNSGVGTSDVLSELKKKLSAEGIELFSAVKNSPSSKYLNSYYD